MPNNGGENETLGEGEPETPIDDDRKAIAT